jgi:hypothetical protein
MVRNYWTVHAAVGCSVTFQCTIRAVIVTTKSHARVVASEWLRTKVLHCWRHADAQLEQQFGGHPFFASRRIRSRHNRNRALHVDRERRPPAHL